MHCRFDHGSEEWNVLLAAIGGHPLQSALWGDAKKAVYGITDRRMALYDQDKLVALARIENKGLERILKLGWIPQGPVLAENYQWEDTQHFFKMK